VTPAEMARQCVKAMDSARELGLPIEDANIILVFPKGWKSKGGFPRGKLACENSQGERVRYFKAMNVLAWLAANGLVDVQVEVAK